MHYVVALAVTLFCLASPDVLATPRRYSWGPYPAYSAWGAIVVGALLLVFVEVQRGYREAMRRSGRGTAHYERARAFYHGNWFAIFATVDFLPAFGVPVYPFGFAIMTLMHAATMFGSIRYHLIEITPEIAAERILSTMPDGLLVADAQGVVRLVNEAAARLLGRRIDDRANHPLVSVTTDQGLREAFETIQTRPPSTQDVAFVAADGIPHTVAVTGSRIDDRSGRLLARLWLLHDRTEQRLAEAAQHRLEGWIRQTQKMESLGVMAGGVAHDFNNILMAIMGNAEIAQVKHAAGEAVEGELRTIVTSAGHAAGLTDQLLTYAGRGTSLEGPVDINALSREMADLMRSAISKKAEIEIQLAERLPSILGDRSQIRQVILNLITNASEALGDHPGTITVRTGVLEVDEPSPPGTAFVGAAGTGRRITLEVTDTGAGMDPDTKARIFDPFFTTKFTGRGLGLATVLGIVKSHGGVIDVQSEPRMGTRVTVILPAIADEHGAAANLPEPATSLKGRGVALVADDEVAVRRVVRQMLSALGFDVLEASDGREAIATFRNHQTDCAVVVLDLTMPGMSGREAFGEIRSLAAAVPVVFMSGYIESEGGDAIGDARTAFLHKPFKSSALTAKIHEAMAGAEPRGA